MKSFILLSLFLTFSPATTFAKEKSRFEKLELFNKVLFLIESQYYRQVDTEKLIEGAIQGMMETLDPHSNFLDKEFFEKMQEDTKGEFGGLGVEVSQKDGVLVVITPIEDTPAYKAGIKSGDKIVEIDHESTMGMTLNQAVDKMRGKAGSKISVGIIREGNDGIKTIVFNREIIKVRPVKFEVVRDHYAYIRLVQFQKRSGESIIRAIKKLKKKTKNKLKGIILDLRSNPGGLLDEAVKVSSIFLKEGIVVSTEGRDPKQKDIKYVRKKGYKELELPVVVLINGASASASEIVAGALQDYGRAIIMGTQSFGKGSVQTVAKIDDVQGVKLTIAQYMTPKNRKIQAVGIVPDVIVDEADGKWISEHRKETSYIRESDLKNHLNATIETAEEKKLRVKKEKEERAKRIRKIKERRRKKKNKDKDEIVKYKASEDFQVNQAINIINTMKIFKK